MVINVHIWTSMSEFEKKNLGGRALPYIEKMSMGHRIDSIMIVGKNVATATQSCDLGRKYHMKSHAIARSRTGFDYAWTSYIPFSHRFWFLPYVSIVSTRLPTILVISLIKFGDISYISNSYLLYKFPLYLDYEQEYFFAPLLPWGLPQC